ncbi:hypothetical protein HYP06_gp052 [Vibrio phage vB_VspP_pVa5]|uniref:Uncharacterized protein n=1 Tax=Vibrio phage vB_VspP_pVa5 TaxID=1913109 RepID=A0A1J0GV74_9CAUD|nr:hypothetical protein HYP06_gp052 [Vibrio phage vB_VspP_pVa5]APC46078.1 hypothetical protein vBVspPpVa5_0052 [Vibrio phage vB_VspP_pVa5]
MTNIELTIKRLETLKPMLLSMDADTLAEREVCKHSANATVRESGAIDCKTECDECVFGVDVSKDADGNVTDYGNLEQTINELKMIALLEA